MSKLIEKITLNKINLDVDDGGKVVFTINIHEKKDNRINIYAYEFIK